MSPSLKYTATGVIGVSAVVAALWAFLDPASRQGVALAGLVAVSVQAIAFTALIRFRGEVNAFLAAWVGGTLARMAVVGFVAFAVIRSGMDGAPATLLALAGFFFALLLLEPVYFKLGGKTSAEHA